MNAIKNILKKIFPTPFLKDAFLLYNKIRILTVDKILFPEFKVGSDQFLLYRKGFPFLESGISLDDLPHGETKTYMQNWDNWTQEEFILDFNHKCWIEPDYGWAIVEPNRLLYYSLGVSRTWFQKKPNLFKFLKKKNVIKMQKVISLRDTGEENYFHFYNDVLGKLFFLQEYRIDVNELPVIVSRKLWDKQYFQYYLSSSPFMQSLNWIIQDKQYIESDSAIFCKPLTHRKDIWRMIFLPLMNNHNVGLNHRIFLNRSKSRLRFVENIDEVEAVAARLGFIVVDTDTMSPAQQSQVFSGAEYLVGIHGAGLTNMAFRRNPCFVLELFPPPDLGYLPYHYMMLAKILGFRYKAFIGNRGRIKYSGGFYIPPDKFEKALVDFCEVNS